MHLYLYVTASYNPRHYVFASDTDLNTALAKAHPSVPPQDIIYNSLPPHRSPAYTERAWSVSNRQQRTVLGTVFEIRAVPAGASLGDTPDMAALVQEISTIPAASATPDATPAT